MLEDFELDVVVVGAGGTGLLTAIGLSQLGLRTALCGDVATVVPAGGSSRTAALLAPTVDMLDRMGVWATLRQAATAIAGIRIVDDTERWPRAPEVLFSAEELNVEALGWNVANHEINAGLSRILESEAKCRLLPGRQVVDVVQDGESALVKLDDGAQLRCRLVVGADGRNSVCRRAAGVEVARRELDQAAITCVFEHSRPHNCISTEFHRRAGPFTTVPLSGNQSSLVWVESQLEAQQTLDLADQNGVAQQLEHRLQGLLGSVSSVTGVQMFPLSFASTSAMTGQRIALVGEAAHVFPPIGAQGLNLGFRDVAALIDIVRNAMGEPGSLGSEQMLAQYDRARRDDVRTRSAGVNLLNNLLISTHWPVHMMRGAGLHALHQIPYLKRQVMRLGMGGNGLPGSMKGK